MFVKSLRTRFRFQAFFLHRWVEVVDMKKAKTYREYKADCIRIAQLMSAKDKEALLKMAEAWEDRAREAERQEQKAEGEK
jgi:hypothetical protein